MAFTMTTATGRDVNPLALTPGDIEIESISHALAHTNRYGGHTAWAYSVAQHSFLLSQVVPHRLAKAALMHDAHEAYIGDVSRPVKQHVPAFRKLEDSLSNVIAMRFGIDLDDLDEIKWYDVAISIDEMSVLMPKVDPQLYVNHHALNVPIKVWGAGKAKVMFLARFRELFPDA